MKRLIIMLVIMGLVAIAGVAAAANTVVISGKTIEITPDGSTDWNSKTAFPNGLSIESIVLCSSAANDKISLRNGSATEAHIFPYIADATGGGLIQYYGKVSYLPFLKASECTFNTAANARIISQLR
jgi:hypothetical protein